MRRLRPWLLIAAGAVLAGGGCDGSTSAPADGAAEADAAPGDGDATATDDAPEPPDATDGGEVAEDVEDDAGSGDAPEDGFEDVVPPRVVTCADEPPPGSDLPDPLPVYPLDCPPLVPGRNTLASTGATRQFLLVVPAALEPTESLPVVFLWHWLGGSAEDFLEHGELQAAVDAQRFLAVIPEAKGDLELQWPYGLWDVEGRVNEEVRFFDDMLACVAEQFSINRNCVSTAGVSAGGLWVSQLGPRRSRLLSSFLSLSGGVGREGDWLNPVRGWVRAEHHLPALVLWGGPTDFCGVQFQQTSRYLEEALAADGHLILECVHNCSHAEPPLEPPAGESKFAFLWRFVLDHPFWLRDGESPYQVTGLPAVAPDWCALGAGSATIRTGDCEGGILGSCL